MKKVIIKSKYQTGNWLQACHTFWRRLVSCSSNPFLPFPGHTVQDISTSYLTIRQKTISRLIFCFMEVNIIFFLGHIYDGGIKRPPNEWFPHRWWWEGGGGGGGGRWKRGIVEERGGEGGSTGWRRLFMILIMAQFSYLSISST